MWIMVDVEADGPAPGLYSMICFGAIVVEPSLDRTFYGQLRPISDHHIPDALKVSGFTREQTKEFPEPAITMLDFEKWLKNFDERVFFIADNNGFDWQFINYYFWAFLGQNPFGHSSANLGSLYKGMLKNTFRNFRRLRKTKHTHHPVDDAKGNAEALLAMVDMGLEIKL